MSEASVSTATVTVSTLTDTESDAKVAESVDVCLHEANNNITAKNKNAFFIFVLFWLKNSGDAGSRTQVLLCNQ